MIFERKNQHTVVWTWTQAELQAMLAFMTRDSTLSLEADRWTGFYLFHDKVMAVATNGAKMLKVTAANSRAPGGKQRIKLPTPLVERVVEAMRPPERAEIAITSERAVVTIVHKPPMTLRIELSADFETPPPPLDKANEIGHPLPAEGPVASLLLNPHYLVDLQTLLPILGKTVELRFHGSNTAPCVIHGTSNDGSSWHATVMPQRDRSRS